jgi:hypothetical protein
MKLPDSPVITRPMIEITKGNKNIINNNIPQPIPPTIETINITTTSEIIINNPMKLSIDFKPGVAIASFGIESKDISKKKVQIIVSQATHTVHLPITANTEVFDNNDNNNNINNNKRQKVILSDPIIASVHKHKVIINNTNNIKTFTIKPVIDHSKPTPPPYRPVDTPTTNKLVWKLNNNGEEFILPDNRSTIEEVLIHINEMAAIYSSVLLLDTSDDQIINSNINHLDNFKNYLQNYL